MKIEIDGSHPKFNSGSLKPLVASMEYYNAPINNLSEGEQAMAESFRNDQSQKDIIAGILRYGPHQILSWNFENLVGPLANMLSETGDYLELVDTRDKQQVKRETEQSLLQEKNWLNASFYETRIGRCLSGGMIVYRGDVDTISDLCGGSIYVTGDVKKIKSVGSGIIFVDGNVEEIDEAGQTVIAVTGSLEKYREYRLRQNGSSREGSSYIFATKIGKVDRNLYKGQTGGLTELSYPTEIDLNWLKNSAPVDGIGSSFDIAKRAAILHAQAILDLAKEAKTANDLKGYARLHMFPYILGYQRGYNGGVLDTLPPGD